jgi:two-component system, LytTR family, sensor kinase
MEMNHRRETYARYRWIALLWLAFSLLNATQIVVGMHAVGMQHEWGRLFAVIFLAWLVWALATPSIVWLGRKFPPIRWKPVSTWLVHLGYCMLIAVIYSAWAGYLQKLFPPWNEDPSYESFSHLWFSAFYGEFHLFFILYAAILAIDYTLQSRQRLAAREAEAARLQAQLSEAQLEALRRQLEPHFLFNALNAIAGLVREQRDEDAVNMIAGLSDLLRRVLDDSGNQEVSLGEEMEFLDKYLEIQKMRFADRLQLKVEVPRELFSARLPSLILQPLVENAIQHGIGKRVSGGQIGITAARMNGSLVMKVSNDGPQLPADFKPGRSGVGISNARARLRSLYGESCDLEIRNRAEGGVEASISLPYKANKS